MAVLTPALLSALTIGFRKEYQTAFDAAMPEVQYTKLSTVVPSSTKSNTYGWLGDFPDYREWIGDRVLKDMAAHGYAIENKDFEATVGVKRTDIDDDNLGIYAPMMAHMGQMSARFPDKLVFDLLKAGKTTLCYDGQNFFDTDHPVYPNVDGTGVPVTVSNMDIDTAARPNNPVWYLLDTRSVLKPIIFQSRKAPVFTAMTKLDDEAVFSSNLYRYGVDTRCNVGFGFWQQAYASNQPLTPDNFNAAYAAMMAVHGDGGKPLEIKPSVLITPPSLRGAALDIVGSERLANGQTNTNKGVVELIVSGRL
jgi:phage major head subunit gpT-like protein